MVWYTLVAIIWKPPMLYLQTKCIMYTSYLGYYQLVAVDSQWTVQTLQTDSQKLVSSKLMKASFQLLMFCRPNKGPLWHICCRTLLWSQSLWAWISIKPLLVSKDITDFSQFARGLFSAIAWGIWCFLRHQPVMHQTIPIQRAVEEGNDLNLASLAFSKRYLLHWHNSVFAYYISHLVDSSTSNCKWIPGYIYMYMCIFISHHVISNHFFDENSMHIW